MRWKQLNRASRHIDGIEAGNLYRHGREPEHGESYPDGEREDEKVGGSCPLNCGSALAPQGYEVPFSLSSTPRQTLTKKLSNNELFGKGTMGSRGNLEAGRYMAMISIIEPGFSEEQDCVAIQRFTMWPDKGWTAID